MVAFYDRSLRLWTAYRLGPDGYQCAPAAYATNRADAIRYARSERDW